MDYEKKINARLKPFGLTTKDLSAEEIKEAKRAVSGNITDGFFASDKLLRITLKRRKDK